MLGFLESAGRDVLCTIMHYLPLYSILRVRSSGRNIVNLIPLACCYKPQRLSLIPRTLFKNLVAQNLLPSVTRLVESHLPELDVTVKQLSPDYLRQFHLTYLDSLGYGNWDCTDMRTSYWWILRDDSFQLDHIKGVVFLGALDP